MKIKFTVRELVVENTTYVNGCWGSVMREGPSVKQMSSEGM